jgi:hypothetical protein
MLLASVMTNCTMLKIFLLCPLDFYHVTSEHYSCRYNLLHLVAYWILDMILRRSMWKLYDKSILKLKQELLSILQTIFEVYSVSSSITVEFRLRCCGWFLGLEKNGYSSLPCNNYWFRNPEYFDFPFHHETKCVSHHFGTIMKLKCKKLK